MNPTVEVAYDDKWFHWQMVILRQPMVQWWRSNPLHLTGSPKLIVRHVESRCRLLSIRLAVRVLRTQEGLLYMGGPEYPDRERKVCPTPRAKGWVME